MWTKDKAKRVISIFLLFLLTLTSLPLTTLGADERRTVIRVGYKEQSNFIKEENGVLTGYGIDYLEKIAEYTMWDYEYIKLPVNEMEDALLSGETDISLLMVEEMEYPEQLTHSEYSVGYENTVIYALEDSEYYHEDYEEINGRTVALVEGCIHAVQFEEYAKAHALSYNTKTYSCTRDAMAALEAGEVDFVASGSYYNYTDVRVIDSFNPLGYYIFTRADKQSIMDEIDLALRHLKYDDASFTGDIYEKYFGNSVVSLTPSFTKEEMEYIRNSDVITVKLLADSKPLSYINESGEPDGVFEDYFKLLAEKSGLKFNLEPVGDPAVMTELTDQLVDKDYIILRTKGALDVSPSKDKLIHSSPLVSTHLAYIRRKDTVQDTGRMDMSFALTKQMKFIGQMLKRYSPDYDVQFYDTAEECMDAVADGRADMTVLDAFLVSYLIQRPIYAEKLVQYHGEEWTNNLCVIADDSQKVLINIINKTIMHISKAEQEEVATMQLLLNPYPLSFGDVLYKYRDMIIGIVVLTVLSMVIYALLLWRITKLRFEKLDYERLQTKIQQDELTGIYNRPYFYRKSRELMNTSQDELCIVLLNIANFQTVNNFYGMDTGDRLLIEVAQYLQEIGKRCKLIAGRFSGDYFYLCMKLEDFLAGDFPKNFQSELVDIELRLSYGVFRIGDQKNLSVSAMCERAAIALHGNNDAETEHIHYYSEKQHEKLLNEQQIESNMKTALEEKQFCVYVQPKYDVVKECIVGGEALVRWMDPEKGMISPGDFIPIFERTGYILQLDYYVWEETCKLIAEWKKQGIFCGPISVNVSRAHFFGTELKDKLLSLVEKYGIEPKDLQLEVTETMCAENGGLLTRKIRELRQSGFEVAMDDFGSGYSSLNMLKEMPLDVIKMDMKFLDGAGDQNKSRFILGGSIRMAHELGLQVVVEGVETLEQVEFLRTIGNASAQGYYFSKPVPSDTYTQMLQEQT